MRINIPLFKRIPHLKSIACNKAVTNIGSSLFQNFDGWSDEDKNDPVSLPYFKYFHLLLLPDMFDGVADKHPDFFINIGNNYSFLS